MYKEKQILISLDINLQFYILFLFMITMLSENLLKKELIHK